MALFFTVNEAWDAGDFNDLFPLLFKTSLGFLVFCILSGAVYLTNDVTDAQRDRLHPKKRLRPIASNQLSSNMALVVSTTLSIFGTVFAFILEPLFGWIATGYLATMIIYTLLLKQIIVLDVLAISAGFVLRAVAGATVIQAPISVWLYICTGLGALFIALVKRRSELESARGRASSQRATLAIYTPNILDKITAITGAAVITTYTLYAFLAQNLPPNHTMTLTIPFVVYGVFRYAYLMYVKNAGENPEDLLISDVPLILTILSRALSLMIQMLILLCPSDPCYGQLKFELEFWPLP